MNEAVKVMIERYNCKSINDYENALKEIIQEIALLGLWRSKFFEKSAFYGGSALRILYKLDRFSEDLDFSLLRKDAHFTIKDYCASVEEELKSFGLEVKIEKKGKSLETNIDSAFIKAGTLENMIIIDAMESERKKAHPGKIIKIKLEVDIDPPSNFKTEARYLLQPLPFSVNTYTLSSLFAGKMHAILCRSWGKRVKGRDWYDLVWFIGRNTLLDLKHLAKRMAQTGHYKSDKPFTVDILKKYFIEKVESIDFSDAKRDVENLIKDKSSLKLWSKDFFKSLCENIKTVSEE